MTDTTTLTGTSLLVRVLLRSKYSYADQPKSEPGVLWYSIDVATAAGLAHDLMVAAAEAMRTEHEPA